MMPLLTHRNHFQFGYNNVAFTFRSSVDDIWFAKYGKCESAPLNFRDECLRTAKTIRNNTSLPIVVLFSGGVDSEVALRSFVEAGIEVSVAILRFKNDLNLHDIQWAMLTCNQLNVPYKIYDLDLLNFWKSEADAFANATYCVSPQLLTTMWLVDQIQGYPILGSGECLLVKERPADYVPGVSPYLRSDWCLWEKEKIASWYRHFMVRQREGCPGFFQYTPELILSYIQDPFVQDLVNDRIQGKLSTESSKLKIYQQHFSLLDRPKYTGFEHVQPEDAEYRARLLTRFPGANQMIKTRIQDLELMLRPDEVLLYS